MQTHPAEASSPEAPTRKRRAWEDPRSKLQDPEKIQIPNSKAEIFSRFNPEFHLAGDRPELDLYVTILDMSVVLETDRVGSLARLFQHVWFYAGVKTPVTPAGLATWVR
jgi:hypothetical protein